MKKLLLLSMVVVLAGCGESQLDRRSKMEASEEPEEKTGNEELKANEEPVESPKAPQAKRRPGDGKNQARPGQQGRRPGGGFGRRDPYANLGCQDITAHVNFEVMTQTSEKLGWKGEPLTTQRRFLHKWGLEKHLEEEEARGILNPERLEERLGLKTLLLPGGISDTMKVLVQQVRV